jgi:hypothetical protein
VKPLLALLCLSTLATAQPAAPKNLELFLLIGQSNMAGRGAIEPQDREPLPRIYMLTQKMEWAPAVDPLHFDKPDRLGVGIGRSFAKVLAAANPNASIGLIPAAFGGSALNEWGAEGEHYPNALRRARKAMENGKLRGILWHQGEADSSKPELARTYRERFAKLAERLRKDLNAPDVPIVVGQLGEFFTRDLAAVVNEQLAMIPLAVPRTAFVSSQGLVHKGDNVHFDTPSLREFGRRYGLAYLSLDPTWQK